MRPSGKHNAAVQTFPKCNDETQPLGSGEVRNVRRSIGCNHRRLTKLATLGLADPEQLSRAFQNLKAIGFRTGQPNQAVRTDRDRLTEVLVRETRRAIDRIVVRMPLPEDSDLRSSRRHRKWHSIPIGTWRGLEPFETRSDPPGIALVRVAALTGGERQHTSKNVRSQ